MIQYGVLTNFYSSSGASRQRMDLHTERILNSFEEVNRRLVHFVENFLMDTSLAGGEKRGLELWVACCPRKALNNASPAESKNAPLTAGGDTPKPIVIGTTVESKFATAPP